MKVCVYIGMCICVLYIFIITHYTDAAIGMRFTLVDDRKRMRTEYWETFNG